ncbi:hypothetical protein C8R44DRAFT_972628 [Mycena epipterygia]|nr:hypothetical protein C8R44DRAFT_972628 [Mycena epipterygia]
MADGKKGKAWTKVTNSSDEAAAAKLWAVYISEAEKYDKALVESWKADMEGMLIFAGLFSASLTAFLVESYKTLNPDSGHTTVTLLAQISQQFAASANGTTFHVLPVAPFTPSTASLVCNALWFISLGLSLSCALIATLLEQWARDLLHKANMRSAPPIRARVFSFLYYGLKRFQMHTVVEIIPLLLHASLLFFFGGLVAFLVPVNFTMTVIAATLLLIVTATYSVLTFLPLWYLDCPYRTPLSAAVWQPVQSLKKLWQRRRSLLVDGELPPSQEKSMVEVMFRAATARSEERTARDYKALVWTMKSLADDRELEPLIEAIPDVLWGPNARRHTNETQIRKLLNNPDVELQSRIQNLFDSCSTGILSAEESKRRRITCYKALWAIANLCKQPRTASDANHSVDFGQFLNLHRGFRRGYDLGEQADPEVFGYFISAKASMIWSTFCAAHGHLLSLREYLVTCEEEISRERTPDLSPVTARLDDWDGKFRGTGAGVVLSHYNPSPSPASLRHMINEFLREAPYRIMFHYLAESTRLSAPPYRWDETRDSIVLDPSVELSSLRQDVEHHLHNTIFTHFYALNAASDDTKPLWIDTSISLLLSSWQPDRPVPIPCSIIQFLNGPRSESVLQHALRHDERLAGCIWACFPTTLVNGPSHPQWSSMKLGQKFAPEDVFTALWRLAAFRGYSEWDPPPIYFEAMLDALSNTESSFAYLCNSIVLLIKQRIFIKTLDHFAESKGDFLPSFNYRLLPQETAIQIPDELRVTRKDYTQCMINRTVEATIHLLAEFLEHCSSDLLPYKAVQTVQKINHNSPRGPIHYTHQIRLANSIHRVFEAMVSTDLLNAIIGFDLFALYAKERTTEKQVPMMEIIRFIPWLDNPSARNKIKDTFATYEKALTSSPDSSPGIRTRLRNILKGLDYWHPEVQISTAGGSGQQSGEETTQRNLS